MKKLLLLTFVGGLIVATQAFAITSEKTSTTSPITFTESENDLINDQCCEIYLENGTGLWYVKCRNKCDKMVKATCTYKIHYKNGTTKTKTATNHIREFSETVVDQGYHEDSYCETISVHCEFVE